jgi:hypothetical protein
MQQSELVDESNFLLYAAKCYDNPQCFDTVEFYDDLARFKYIKRLFRRYQETGELKERLIINHIIVIYNVFGVEASTQMLFLKLREHLPILKPFLVMLGHMPPIITVGVERETIYAHEIDVDPVVEDILKKSLNG